MFFEKVSREIITSSSWLVVVRAVEIISIEKYSSAEEEERRGYPHYANTIERNRNDISKGNFHFAFPSSMHRFTVGRDRVRNFIRREGGKKKKEDKGQKGG